MSTKLKQYSVKLGAGSKANRPGSPVEGDIRYNTDNNIYEGYADTGHLSLGGIYSDDFNTSIDTTNTTNKIFS